jgi:hypothetical protein
MKFLNVGPSSQLPNANSDGTNEIHHLSVANIIGEQKYKEELEKKTNPIASKSQLLPSYRT